MAQATVAEWLEALRRGGLALIDPQMAIDVERLVTVWSAARGEMAVSDAAEALAARIATGPEEYRAVRDHFVRTFGREDRGAGMVDVPRAPKGHRNTGAPADRPGSVSMRWPWILLAGVVSVVLEGATIETSPDGSEDPTDSCDATESCEMSGVDSATGSDVMATSDDNSGVGDTETNTDSEDAGYFPGAMADPKVVMTHPEQTVALPVSTSSYGSHRALDLLFLSAVVVALLFVYSLRLFRCGRMVRMHRQAQIAAGRAKRRAARMRDGPSEGELYCFKVPPPLEPTAIDAAADLLGRSGQNDVGDRLDVSCTVDRTVRAGGRLEPRFLRTNQQPPLVVLVDVEDRGRAGHAHPLAHAVDWILQRWQSTGLHLLRFDYVDRPDFVWEPRLGRRMRLEEIGRYHGNARLLVWSRLRRPGDLAQRSAWLAELRAWTRRAWIDLDPRPVRLALGIGYGRGDAELEYLAEVERCGLVRYPLTGPGLIAAARHVVTTRGLPPPVREQRTDPKRLERALEHWAAAACCVPDPTWMHLDALRVMLPDVRRVIPEACGVWWLLRWLEQRGCLELPASAALYRLALTDDADAKLLKDDLRIEVDGQARSLEQWVRSRLVDQLKDAEPKTEIEGWLRDAKLGYHRWVYDPEDGVATLRSLLGSPADAVARQLLARVQHRLGADGVKGRVTEQVGEALGRRVALKSVARMPPKRWEIVLTVAVVSAVVAIGSLAAEDENVAVRVPAQYEVVPVLLERTEPTEPSSSLLSSSSIAASSKSLSLPKTETVNLSLPDGARPMRLLRIDDGLLWIGSPGEGRHQSGKPSDWATLTQPFMICETEVTQAQWMAVMGKYPNRRQFSYGDDVAVHHVSWLTAMEFLNMLSHMQNLSECYARVDGVWVWERKCEGYRLPTEAEWEYSARAGSDTDYSFGDDAKELDDYGWYKDNSGGVVHPAAQKMPNSWGLFDIHGNLWEWVWGEDEFGTGSERKADLVERMAIEYFVSRGGAFNSDAQKLRSSSRGRVILFNDLQNNGLRCARGPYLSAPGRP